VAPHGRRSIGSRLLAALILPVLLVIALSTAAIALGARRLTAARDAAASVDLVVATSAAIEALERERAATYVLLRSPGQPARADLNQARNGFDTSRDRLTDLVAGSRGTAASGVIEAIGTLSGVDQVRGRVDAVHSTGPASTAGTIEPRTADDAYSRAVNGLTATADGIARRGGLPAAVATGLDAVRAAAAARAAGIWLDGLVLSVLTADRFADDDYLRFVAAITERDQAARRLRGIGGRVDGAPDNGTTGAVVRTWIDRASADPAVAAARAVTDRLVGAAGAPSVGGGGDPWQSASGGYLARLADVEQQLIADTRTARSAVERDAMLLMALAASVAVLTLVVSGLLAVATARSLRRPLARLTELVRETTAVLPAVVADARTDEERDPAAPEGVDVGATQRARSPRELERAAVRDSDIGRLTDAVDELRETARRLAAEQARDHWKAVDALAGLVRRQRALVRQQLAFISDLEREEADPAVLADLFELDHLATRIRRTNQSLFVLTRPDQAESHRDPASVTDVLRSAIGEVEDYRRVVLSEVDEVKVAGPAAVPLAHLVAELVDNALRFSPPGSEVHLQGRWLGAVPSAGPAGPGAGHDGAGGDGAGGDGAGGDVAPVRAHSGDYLIAVIDAGPGLPDGRLLSTNEQLAGTPGDRDPRQLGLHLVARIAATFELVVTLQRSPLAGITARVTVPASLISAASRDGSGLAPRLRASRRAISGEAAVATAAATNVAGAATGGAVAAAGRHADPDEHGPADGHRAADGHAPADENDHGAGPRPAPGPGLTRNGLVKRIPRTRSAAEGDSAVAAATPDSPERVRDRLSSFRAGVKRAEREAVAGQPASAAKAAAIADDQRGGQPEEPADDHGQTVVTAAQAGPIGPEGDG
jgi:signal transduction histidine kinase